MSNNIDRPEGRFVKNYKLIMDVAAFPNGMTAPLFTKLCDSGIVFYDSTRGRRPKLYDVGEDDGKDKMSIEVVDTEGKAIDVETINARFEDEEFWRKELYKCKQSPLYYFSNYFSTNPKPSQDEIDSFLASRGFEKNEDSDDAAEINEKTKKIRDEFSATITLEHLKDLKPVRDRIDAEYEQETEERVAKAAKAFKCTPTHTSKIISTITTKIMKTPVKEATDELRFYINERTGKWDKNLIRATEIDILVRLWENLI